MPKPTLMKDLQEGDLFTLNVKGANMIEPDEILFNCGRCVKNNHEEDHCTCECDCECNEWHEWFRVYNFNTKKSVPILEVIHVTYVGKISDIVTSEMLKAIK